MANPRLLTYIDSCIVIAACDSTDHNHQAALSLLSNTSLKLVASNLVRLETVAAALRRGDSLRASFASELLLAVSEWVAIDEDVIDVALEISGKFGGPSALDAIHAACAIRIGASVSTVDRKFRSQIRRLGLEVVEL